MQTSSIKATEERGLDFCVADFVLLVLDPIEVVCEKIVFNVYVESIGDSGNITT